MKAILLNLGFIVFLQFFNLAAVTTYTNVSVLPEQLPQRRNFALSSLPSNKASFFLVLGAQLCIRAARNGENYRQCSLINFS